MARFRKRIYTNFERKQKETKQNKTNHNTEIQQTEHGARTEVT